ncbi:MAG TPA: hypothetical protein VE398_00775 [Acidobacteriota bacterium]|nr:hypothetical protein [Acidobacteriota bacterium]
MLEHLLRTLTFLLFLTIPSRGLACECAGPTFPVRKDVTEAVKNADLIFSGVVNSIYLWSPNSIPDIYGQLVAEFSALEVFKGPNRRHFFVSTGFGAASSKGPADCGLSFPSR